MTLFTSATLVCSSNDKMIALVKHKGLVWQSFFGKVAAVQCKVQYFFFLPSVKGVLFAF